MVHSPHIHARQRTVFHTPSSGASDITLHYKYPVIVWFTIDCKQILIVMGLLSVIYKVGLITRLDCA